MTQREILRNELYNIAKENEDAYFVVIDGVEMVTIPELKKMYPERVILCGISEQNSQSIAAGIALHGKKVFLINFGPYAYSRTFEELKMDISYNCADVKILAVKTGFRFNARAGYSHWAIDDINCVRTMPNIEILTPSTQDDLINQLNYAKTTTKPLYIRLENFHSDFNLSINHKTVENYEIVKGKDAVIFAQGAMVEKAYEIHNLLKYANIKITVVNCTKLKPFDETPVKKFINKNIPIITLEEQTKGGLSSIVAEIIAEYGGGKCKFMPVCIDTDEYNLVGGYEYLCDKLLDLKNLPDKILRLTDKTYSIFKLPILKVKHGIINQKQGYCKYLLFGFIPLLKIKIKQKINKNKLRHKIYLFGFIRIH